MEANELTGLDTIVLASGTYTLTLVGTGEEAGDLNVLDDLRIEGDPGAKIDGGGIDRILMANGASLEIEGLTLLNGSTSSAGGCLWTNRALTLREVEITECESQTGGALHFSSEAYVALIERSWIHANNANMGGGILSYGNLVLLDTTVSSNSATVDSGGGIFSTGYLSLNNSTIYLNTALGSGGGVYSNGLLRLSSSTVVGNLCDIDADENGTGCGIFTLGNSSARNNVIARNMNWNSGMPVIEADDCDGLFVSDGYNLVGHPGALCSGFSAATNDLVGAPTLDPELGSLGDHGGPTPTMVPDTGSPLIDGGNPVGCLGNLGGIYSDPPTTLDHDQRGLPRVLDGDSNGVARCDIGAVENALFLFTDDFETGDLSKWSSSVH